METTNKSVLKTEPKQIWQQLVKGDDVDSLLKSSVSNTSSGSVEVDPDISEIPQGKIGNAVLQFNTPVQTQTVRNNSSVVPAPTTQPVVPPVTTQAKPTDSSFKPVDVFDIYGLMNAARDSFDWKKHGLPDFGLGMTDEQKKYLNYQTDYLEVTKKDREKPVDLNAIAAQLDNPNSRLSKYVIESGKAISQAGGRVTGDRSLANLAKALRAVGGNGSNIFELAAKTGNGLLIEASDVNFSIDKMDDVTFEGVDEEKQKEMNDLRKKFFEYISPFLANHHPISKVAKYLDDYIKNAIKNGPNQGSLNGEIITYYPQKGELISSLAVYSSHSKRPTGFFKEVEKYFDSMIELAGKPKETPKSS